MKKSLLKTVLVAVALTMSIGMQAKDFPTGKYYLQNVASKLWWGAGNNWGTQASLLEHPEYVKLINNGDGTYKMETQVSNGDPSYYFDGGYMDGSPIALTITEVNSDTYTISNGSSTYGYSGANTVLANDASGNNSYWKIYSEADMENMMLDATSTDPMDVTFLILDPGFGRNNRNHGKWSMTSSNYQFAQGNYNNHANECCESWHANFYLVQENDNVLNGNYELTAQGVFNQDGTNNTDLPVIFINDATGTFNTPMTNGEGSVGALAASFGTGLYPIPGVQTHVSTGLISVGCRLDGNTQLWCGWDNFALYYQGPTQQDLVDMFQDKCDYASDLLSKEFTMSTKAKAILQAAFDEASGADVSSADDLKAAIKKLNGALHDPIVTQSMNSYAIMANGIPDNSLDGWTCTNTQAFHINTWSHEGDTDGTGMTTPFVENWCGVPGVLDDSEIYFSLPGLDPGIYQFSALIRAYSEAGNAPTGASLFAMNREIEFATGNLFEFEYNKNTLIGIFDNYAMTGEVGADGIFRFGVKISGATFNWMAFKNCKVSYVGTAIDANAVDALYATRPWGLMNRNTESAMEDAYELASNNPNLDNYEALAKAIAAAQASVKAYENASLALAGIEEVANSTNIYTFKAYEAFNADGISAAIKDGELTDVEANSLVDPTIPTGWHGDTNVDNFLLSAWDTNPDFIEPCPYYINTWSVEGVNDGSGFTIPFFEYWVNDSQTLEPRTLTATMTDIDEGDYDVKAWVRVRRTNNNNDDPAGITLQLNDGTPVNVCTGNQVAESQFFIGNFTAQGHVDNSGVMKVKFSVANNNISWLSYKNVKYMKAVVTGIQSIESTGNSHNAIFNLNGQQVDKAAKGLYIKNGKKIVVK